MNEKEKNSAAQRLRDEELKNMANTCDECHDGAKFKIVNGDDTTVLCKPCAQVAVFELITENEYTDFHSYSKETGIIIIK